MEWGFLSSAHITSIILAFVMIISLHFILRHRSTKTQIITLLCLSGFGIFNVVHGMFNAGDILEGLPLHLCEINALIVPAAILSRNKTVNNLLLLWSLGALAAIVVNTSQAHYDIISIKFFKYYFSHVFEFGIPLLMFSLNLVKKDASCIKSTLGITLSTYTTVHMINMAINTFGGDCSVNYMYSVKPENPVFDLFYAIIPSSYWYLYLTLPIILAYLIFIYWKQVGPAIKAKMHKKKAVA